MGGMLGLKAAWGHYSSHIVTAFSTSANRDDRQSSTITLESQQLMQISWQLELRALLQQYSVTALHSKGATRPACNVLHHRKQLAGSVYISWHTSECQMFERFCITHTPCPCYPQFILRKIAATELIEVVQH